jgi:FkbM family methyltransferase
MNAIRILRRIRDIGVKTGLKNIPGAKTTYKTIERLVAPNNSKYKTLPATHEPAVTTAFSRLCSGGDTVIEIGGFHGSHSINLSNAVGPSGTVIVFEPHPDHASLIRDRLEENSISNVVVEEKAASDSNGEIRLWMDEDDSSTSSIAVSHENGEYYNVESISIGDYISELPSGEVDLCKIDIEGGEYELIMNSTLLSHTNTLICELHPQFIGREKAVELFTKLQNAGIVSDINGNEMTAGKISEHSTEHIIWKQSPGESIQDS